MDPDTLQIAQILALIFAFIVGISIVGMANKWFKRRMERPQLPDRDARLDRLEQAVDAIAIEVERVSEAQRYTTKLLAERHEVPVETKR